MKKEYSWKTLTGFIIGLSMFVVMAANAPQMFQSIKVQSGLYADNIWSLNGSTHLTATTIATQAYVTENSISTSGSYADPSWITSLAKSKVSLGSVANALQLYRSGSDYAGIAQGAIFYYSGTEWAYLPAGTSGQFLKTLGAGANPLWDTPSGAGDVIGPASSTDNAIVRFDQATGKLIQNSNVTVDDDGTINIPTGQSYKINGTALAKGDIGLGNVPNTDCTNATNIASGTLSTDRYSAYADLSAETKIGTGAAQVAAGDHTHGQLHDAASVTDSDTIDFTLTGQAITGSVKVQSSITSDASGIKLSGDAGSPGNSKLYGTNSSGTKGWYDQPATGTPADTAWTGVNWTSTTQAITAAKVQDALYTMETGWYPGASFTRSSDSQFTVTHTATYQEWFKVGRPVRYSDDQAAWNYGMVTAYSTGTVTIAGAPMDTSHDAYIQWGNMSKVQQVDFFISGAYGDGTASTLLASDMKTYFKWQSGKSYCVKFSCTENTVDTGAEPKVNVRVNSQRVSTNDSNLGVQLTSAGTWVDNSAVAINTTYYDINYDEAIEIECSAAGGTGDASGLTVTCTFVQE